MIGKEDKALFVESRAKWIAGWTRTTACKEAAGCSFETDWRQKTPLAASSPERPPKGSAEHGKWGYSVGHRVPE
jgi:hypothetical protein